MISKRQFFKSIFALASCLALAPEIAFGVRLDNALPKAPQLDLMELIDACYDVMRMYQAEKCGDTHYLACDGNLKPTFVTRLLSGDAAMGTGFFEQMRSLDNA